MLGKLMKYEWKATWKLLLCANLLIGVMTALAWCMVHMVEFSDDSSMMGFMAVMTVLTYVGSMFAVAVGTSIYLIHRFYTSTYGDQGYLLHTLPVDAHHIIIAKVLVSAMWLIFNSLIMYLSVMFLVASTSDIFKSMMEGMATTIEVMGSEKITVFTIFMTLVAYLFSQFARVLKVGACISLGQLSSNHKLMMSFAWYVGIYIVESVLSVVFYAIRMALHLKTSYLDDYISVLGGSWETTLLSGIISCVIFYILTWYVMSRKLNLD